MSGSSSGSLSLDQFGASNSPIHASTDTTSSANPGNPTSGRTRIIFVRNQSQISETIDLDATGEIFFLSLERAMRKIKFTVERNLHYVRFSTERGVSTANCAVMHLMEDTVCGDWDDAVEWIKSNKANAPRGFYAMVEQEDVH